MPTDTVSTGKQNLICEAYESIRFWCDIGYVYS